MQKRIKITLYIILILTIFAVLRLMFWNTNPNVEVVPSSDTETSTWWEVEDSWFNYEKTDTFEEDVMKDLEWFFWNNNGYEDVQWEYWFTNPENQ